MSSACQSALIQPDPLNHGHAVPCARRPVQCCRTGYSAYSPASLAAVLSDVTLPLEQHTQMASVAEQMLPFEAVRRISGGMIDDDDVAAAFQMSILSL